MKHFNTLFLAFLLIGAVLTFSACNNGMVEPDPDERTLVVTFENASLANYVREQLNLATNAPITRGELLRLERVDLRTEMIEDVNSLVGLEHATELNYLDFGGNPVTSLTPVAGLRKITYLRLNQSGVTDLSPIREYTTLTYFNANQASPGISDLTPLSQNTGLQTMILRGQPLGNDGLRGISSFVNLYRLNLRSTGVTDLSVIADLMSRGAFLSTTPGASELGSDPTLNLQDLEITNCEVLNPYRDRLAGEIEGACRVPTPGGEAGNDQTAVVFGDEALANLIRTQLNLEASAPITRGALQALTTVDLRTLTSLTSLVGLEYATQVSSLRIDGTQVVDVSPISGWTKLTYFNANRGAAATGGITDLSPLLGSREFLQTVIVRGNHFGDAAGSVLVQLTSLHRLNIRDSGVTNGIVTSAIQPLLQAGALQTTTPGYTAADSEIAIQGNGLTSAGVEPISLEHFPNRVPLSF
ncbi:hypothetical protein M8998_12825 [Sphingobacterium sp. lm-10]|uniref:hypothetical protein n=1 Tax=Sphingobacterium sp. lm-10 TaxID=2944904 RepID=UPI00202215E1|nr:hypothetical protein [Sphingobacterium sp. lm-10]MCL7988826.1 hypothetical protein [Sphingobacterium sp. lm-10]